ncbi:DNA-binding transcriptional regulator, GntR family [Arthrobacter sp. cf158]|uniref:GntR family transcriptional regulator n=1 Tax=Arthrobacter sp. cf158 TaxID=1761744 RepID=UPI00089D0217|nr:GntR family transcriptional regulator [Arthrobacter sp. cf158]SDW91444.1 DNA-binding transcriptional regulator, GntR family [Arthrobacter sp. cf158]
MNSAVKRTAAPLRQEVVGALRRAIVSGEFAPGQRLVESVLCDKFAVSRTVIREVLRQLEAEGLVIIVPNRGPEVATLTIKEAENLYEVRRALESLAGSLFAERATEEQCSKLVECLSDVKMAMGSDDPDRKLEVKDQYYAVLLDGAGNDEISKLLNLVNARTQVLRMYSLSSENRGPHTVAEISRITAAAALDRDPDEARIACEDHVRSAANAALREMKRAIAK